MQHVAARMLVLGHGSNAIAGHLGLNRHSIGRWKRQPEFLAEVERLRVQVTAAAVQQAARMQSGSAENPRRPPPAPGNKPPRVSPDRRKSDAEDDRECEEMIAKIMRRLPRR
jgi:hypothetical protein